MALSVQIKQIKRVKRKKTTIYEAKNHCKYAKILNIRLNNSDDNHTISTKKRRKKLWTRHNIDAVIILFDSPNAGYAVRVQMNHNLCMYSSVNPEDAKKLSGWSHLNCVFWRFFFFSSSKKSFLLLFHKENEMYRFSWWQCQSINLRLILRRHSIYTKLPYDSHTFWLLVDLLEKWQCDLIS